MTKRQFAFFKRPSSSGLGKRQQEGGQNTSSQQKASTKRLEGYSWDGLIDKGKGRMNGVNCRANSSGTVKNDKWVSEYWEGRRRMNARTLWHKVIHSFIGLAQRKNTCVYLPVLWTAQRGQINLHCFQGYVLHFLFSAGVQLCQPRKDISISPAHMDGFILFCALRQNIADRKKKAVRCADTRKWRMWSDVFLSTGPVKKLQIRIFGVLRFLWLPLLLIALGEFQCMLVPCQLSAQQWRQAHLRWPSPASTTTFYFFLRNQFSMVDFSKLIRLSLRTDSIMAA